MRAGKNVIFHRVPEERSDKVEERKDSDLIYVTELDGVFNIKLHAELSLLTQYVSISRRNSLTTDYKNLSIFIPVRTCGNIANNAMVLYLGFSRRISLTTNA